MTRFSRVLILGAFSVAASLPRAAAFPFHGTIASTRASSAARPEAARACGGDATTLCLNNSRFTVRVTFATPSGQSGSGQAVPLTIDTGYFWFFSANNVELVVKVVDGRAVNNRFWVFAGGLTNVSVVITVTDTVSGAAKTYTNPQGAAFQPIQDTSAFAAKAPEASASVPIDNLTGGAAVEHAPTRVESGFTPEAAPCATDPTTLCLNNGRFKIQTSFSTPQGQTGSGQAVALTGDTGYFWFFSSSNIEMVVKALDACAFNSRFWTFAGGLTNVNVVMTVTDTQSGAVKTYTNPQGTAFQPIQDTAAFPTCGPSPASFARSWNGTWVDRTFSSSGTANMTVTVDSVAQTFSITLDVQNLFGSGNKPPQTFTGTYTSTGGTFGATSAVYGNVTGSITFPATSSNQYNIAATCSNVPDNFVQQVDLTGTISPQKVELNFTITIRQSAGGGSAFGTLTLN